MAPTQVWLHLYDVTNSVSMKMNVAIVHLNRLLRDGIGVGGIFHGGIEVYEEEWSFGYCETGSGVFSCVPKENFMYTYRESMSLGSTTLSEAQVTQILIDLSREWPGYSYDLLSRNCNHFCEEFCARLDVDKPPGWVNRFAYAGDIAVEAAGSTVERLRQAKSDILSAGKHAVKSLFGSGIASSQSSEILVTRCTSVATSQERVSVGTGGDESDVQTVEEDTSMPWAKLRFQTGIQYDAASILSKQDAMQSRSMTLDRLKFALASDSR